ncbi:hypothetical protein WMO24_10765 [Ruthenibacterium sp. CLA-JM-H11]|uniref:Uncharacterized protein n=1 Tax=Ruthenibacterium intestinale TaxID=3133163 RepID=A0ABV1GGL2_9FIRM
MQNGRKRKDSQDKQQNDSCGRWKQAILPGEGAMLGAFARQRTAERLADGVFLW